jgi:hypothetical protein
MGPQGDRPHRRRTLIQWAPGLPKTRSGKIMRRILRKIAENDFGALGDTSTLADPSVVDDLIVPPDPPPVKGLGIPPLDTAVVGDFDEIETPPEAPNEPGTPAISDLLEVLQDTTPPGLDRRA